MGLSRSSLSSAVQCDKGVMLTKEAEPVTSES